MKTAIYQNSQVDLEELDRDHYQKIYLAGKNAELTCPVCSETVLLYLGIKESPYFYHARAPKKPCNPPSQTPLAEKTEPNFVVRNGFRIPQGRTITGDAPVKTAQFTKPKKIEVSGRPVESSDAKQGILPPYLQQLRESGIRLDAAQTKAVKETDGSILVLAGAGSGKTRVLTARTAYMLEARKIDPRNIMLVTFTSKAAAEMKSRLVSYPEMNSRKINQLVAGTFHSLFYRILLFHAPQQWSADKLLKKEWQRTQLLKEAGKELDLTEKDFAFDLALQQIGYWKNSLLLPDQINPDSDWEQKTAFLFKRYEEFKNKQGLFDFDDMLIGCYQLFNANQVLLDQYQNRFHYFLIDEFQDINKVQYELIKIFSAKNKNVCAVGDDDQSIYSFRGSNPQYLLEFEKDFPEAKVVTLDQNYRSSQEIVLAANQMIAVNKQRKSKKMNAQFLASHSPLTFYPYDEEEEATMIVTDLQERIANGANPSEFAILFRTNAASRAIFERLATSNLPFKIEQDTDAFYDRRIIKMILSFLRISLNEDHSSALSDILAPLFLKQSALKDVKALSILEDCSYLEALSQLKTGHTFQEKKLKKAVEVIRALKYSNPLTAIEKIEKEIGVQEFLKKRGNEANKIERGSDDLKDLKVAAKDFPTIEALLMHAEHMSAMIKEVKNLSRHFQDAITLSTIHRSKGLEYPTVYVIGVVDGCLPHDYALESLRNGDISALEEERRLLYVAMTRAIRQLFISIPQTRRGKKAHISRLLNPLKNYLR